MKCFWDNWTGIILIIPQACYMARISQPSPSFRDKDSRLNQRRISSLDFLVQEFSAGRGFRLQPLRFCARRFPRGPRMPPGSSTIPVIDAPEWTLLTASQAYERSEER